MSTTEWKDIGDNQDGGDATQYGGQDMRKVMRLLNGQPNVGNVFMNSNFEFKFGKLWLRNQGNTFSTRLDAGSVTSNVVYSFPSHSINDQVVLRTAFQELEGKTINASKNTIIGIGGASSSNRKSGRIQAPRVGVDGSFGEGLLQGHINMTTPVASTDPSPIGTIWTYSTGTTSNTNTGLRYDFNWARRQYNPRIKVKCRIPSTTANTWFLFGLSVDINIQATETDPINDTESAFLLGWRNTDGAIMVFRNGGTNASTSTPTVVNTGASKPTGVTEWEINMRSSGDVLVTITDGTTGATIFTDVYSTNLPATAVEMSPIFQLKNTDSLNHDLILCYMEQEQDV